MGQVEVEIEFFLDPAVEGFNNWVTELLTGQLSLTPASRSIKGAFQGVTIPHRNEDGQRGQQLHRRGTV